MKFKKSKKGQVLSGLGSLAIGIVTLVIVLAVTFLILSQTQEQIGNVEGVTCVNNASFDVTGGGGTSVACNATHTLANAVADIPDWVPLELRSLIVF